MIDPPIVLHLTAEERRWYVWLHRELVKCARLQCADGDTLDRVLDELEVIVDELLGRIPER